MAPRLKLGFVDHKAALFACKKWHYSNSVPAGKVIRIGVWENDAFIGVVLFSRGATTQIGSPYGLEQTEICELTRVALGEHKTAVSRIVAIAFRLLRKNSPGLRMVISYAAVEEGHHGGIYQAGNWIYEGPIDSYTYIIKGQKTHARTVSSRFKGKASLSWIRENVDPHAEKVPDLIRHKYLMPLDVEMRRSVEHLHKPYPKRDKQAMADDQSAQRQCDTDRHAPKDLWNGAEKQGRSPSGP
ncbi:hypothetical protein [Roseibium alexandrii]|uniref:Mom family adenine methylcarbamoylation protein n=1 Tax=Roseibium alexandrii TaxID=388408 RepID=UPI003751C832